MHWFPGIRLENFLNGLSNRFDWPPSKLAQTLAWWCKMMCLPVSAACIIENLVDTDGRSLGYIVFALMVMFTAIAPFTFILKGHAFYSYLCTIAMMHSIACYTGNDLGIAHSVLTIAMVICYIPLLSKNIEEISSKTWKADQDVWQNGALPQPRDTMLVYYFIFLYRAQITDLP